MSLERAELLFRGEWAARPHFYFLRRLRQLGLGLTLGERRLLLGTVDLLLLNGALLGALWFWSELPLSAPALLASFKWFLTLAAVWLVLALSLDVYDPARSASVTQSLLYTGLAVLLAGLIYVNIPWLTPPLGRRMQTFGFIFLAVGGVAAWRALYARYLYQPAFRHRVLLVGNGTIWRPLIRELQAAAFQERSNPFRGTGYEVMGVITEHDRPAADRSLDVPALAAENLIHEARRLNIDEIIVADERNLSPTLREALLDCWELGLQVAPLSVAYERLTARVPVELAVQELCQVAGAAGGAADSPGRRLFHTFKRLVDILLGLVGVLLMALLCLPVGLANLISSRGPLFYRQHRVGRGGRPYVMIKFRTMVPQAEQVKGAVWASENDPRVTPIGRWLRRLRLDELPQFINVLRGEMSVVGPRPERPQFVGELVHQLPLYRARHAMRPGITGWAQIRYRYGNSVKDAQTKLEYDLYYIKHAGFYLDLLIFLQTFPVMLQLKGF